MKIEIRCGAPHPTVPNWVCRAQLNVAVPPGYVVRSGVPYESHCITVTCWRCGAAYEVCPTDLAA
jgi:ferredoxin